MNELLLVFDSHLHISFRLLFCQTRKKNYRALQVLLSSSDLTLKLRWRYADKSNHNNNDNNNECVRDNTKYF